MVSARVLNRTLLQRQHLLERSAAIDPLAMVEHLIGLHAQETTSPYLSLFARVTDFDPLSISAALESRAVVRVTAMRGTLHLAAASDALMLRAWLQPLLTRHATTSDWGKGFPVEHHPALVEVTHESLLDGPLPLKQLSEQLAGSFDGLTTSAAGNLAKSLVPLVQLPPRGMWQRSGGIVYDLLERAVEAPLVVPDPADVVRRYLRAFGPATPADVTAWSGRTGMKAAFDVLGEELTRLTDDAGRAIWDLADLSLATGDEPAPPRLLGTYDNLWLSHARRDRVTTAESRSRWQAPNGGLGPTLFVDGWMAGLWSSTDSGKVDVTLFRALSRTENAELADEITRIEALLAG